MASRAAIRAPSQNAYAERFAQTLQQECLDWFIVLGEEHLRYIVNEFVAHYHAERPHSATGHLPPGLDKPPDAVKSLGPKDVVLRERLGGLLKHYERKAAYRGLLSRVRGTPVAVAFRAKTPRPIGRQGWLFTGDGESRNSS